MPQRIVFFLVLWIAPAFACTCGAPRPCGNIVRSGVVFTGLAVPGGAPGKTRFFIEHGYKGVHTGDLVEVDRFANTSCGVEFDRGERYVVYADRQNGQVWTNQCRGSKLLANAVADLRYLDAWEQGRTPTELIGVVIPDARAQSSADWDRYYKLMTTATIRILGPGNKAVEAKPQRMNSARKCP